MFNFPYDSSRVTIELGEIIDSGVNLWDFEYKNWYSGEAKRELEQKLIDRYRFRQIGFETPARFMHHFRTRVKEIAPYYFELHKSVELFNSIEDPLQAYDLTETYTEETTGTRSENGESSGTRSENGKNTGSSNSSTSGSSKTETSEVQSSEGTQETKTNKTVSADGTKRFSNTPQGSLANLDSYMTEATINEDTNTETGTDTATSSNSSEGSGSTSTTNTATATATSSGTSELTATSSGTSETTGEEAGTKKYTLTRKGNIGVTVLGEEMIKHRKAIINLDEDFINEFKDLFLGVY